MNHAAISAPRMRKLDFPNRWNDILRQVHSARQSLSSIRNYYHLRIRSEQCIRAMIRNTRFSSIVVRWNRVNISLKLFGNSFRVGTPLLPSIVDKIASFYFRLDEVLTGIFPES